MDEFMKCMQQQTSVGGIHCDCCNPYHGKHKSKLNRLARRKLKQQTANEIKQLGDNDANTTNQQVSE